MGFIRVSHCYDSEFACSHLCIGLLSVSMRLSIRAYHSLHLQAAWRAQWARRSASTRAWRRAAMSSSRSWRIWTSRHPNRSVRIPPVSGYTSVLYFQNFCTCTCTVHTVEIEYRNNCSASLSAEWRLHSQRIVRTSCGVQSARCRWIWCAASRRMCPPSKEAVPKVLHSGHFDLHATLEPPHEDSGSRTRCYSLPPLSASAHLAPLTSKVAHILMLWSLLRSCYVGKSCTFECVRVCIVDVASFSFSLSLSLSPFHFLLSLSVPTVLLLWIHKCNHFLQWPVVVPFMKFT